MFNTKGEWIAESSNPIIDRKIRKVRELAKPDISVEELRVILGYFTKHPIVNDRGLIGRGLILAVKSGNHFDIDAESVVNYLKTLSSNI